MTKVKIPDMCGCSDEYFPNSAMKTSDPEHGKMDLLDSMQIRKTQISGSYQAPVSCRIHVS